MDTILRIEQCAANALPSPVVKTLGGWRLRYAYGVTRRANSVLAERHEGNLDENLQTVEGFYASYNAPSRFQLCPVSQPANLESILLERGYQKVSGAKVQTISLGSFKTDHDTSSVDLFPNPNQDWFKVYRQVERGSLEKEKVRTWMLEHIQPKAAFALLYLDEQPAAVGLGVFEDGYLGIFNMATLETFRGRGGASTILAALVQWAKSQQTHTCYLQVSTENLKAQSTYQNVGFRDLYDYSYFEKAVN